MGILFRISKFLLNTIGFLAVAILLILTALQVNFHPFTFSGLTNQQLITNILFVISAGTLGLYFVFGILGIVFRTAKKLRSIISFIFCLIGLAGLAIVIWQTATWLTNHNAWVNFKNQKNGILNIVLFSISVGFSASYLIFGPLLFISRVKKGA